MLNELNNAYCAGILDGEGYFAIHNRGYSKRFKRDKIGLRICVRSTDKALVEWLHKHYGGRLNYDVDKRNVKYQHDWSVHGSAGLSDVLDKVIPYLIIKKDIARKMQTFMFQSSKNAHG